MTSKLSREALGDETLAELIAFRRSRVEYWQKEGLPYQKLLHDSMMLALEELQERRKAERDSEPVAYTDEEELNFVNDMACMWTKGMGINEVPLYRHAQQPVVPDDSDPRDAFEVVFPMPKYVQRCGAGYAATSYSAWNAHNFVQKWEGWNACRAAMLQGKAEPVSNGDELPPGIKPAPELDSMIKNAGFPPGNSPVTQDGWVACSERMPESNGVYFGWDGKRVLEVNCFFGGWSANQFIHGEITHWMPLPNPPKEVTSARVHPARNE